MADIADAHGDQVIPVNLRGDYLSMKHEVPLVQQRGAAIVNTSSGACVKGFPAEPRTEPPSAPRPEVSGSVMCWVFAY